MLEARRTPLARNGAVTVPGLRWWIVGLVFLATLINYLDRLTLSVLGPVITADLHLSNTEFGGIVTWFLLAYTLSQGLSGRLYDHVGTKAGFSISIVVWSLAAMAHGFARGIASLSACRFVLGLGEAGNWPGAAKAVAEWFPARQRAFAMGIFNSGAAIGSIVAPPLIVFLSLRYGWQATFFAVGALGFGWLALWLAVYHAPAAHPWLSREEHALIREGRERDAKGSPPSWRELLKQPGVRGIVAARFFTDPIWWLYITWLPMYLAHERGFSLKEIGMFAWVPFVAADAGSLAGGWLSGHLISRGWSVDRARKTVIYASAALMPAGVLAAFASDPMVALALIGLVLFGFQAWINNVQTLPADFFPARAVASVAGLGGVAAGIGSMIFIFTTGAVVDRWSYTPILVASGVLAPIGTFALVKLAGTIQPVRLAAKDPP